MFPITAGVTLRELRMGVLREEDAKVVHTNGKTLEPRQIDSVPVPTEYEVWSECEHVGVSLPFVGISQSLLTETHTSGLALGLLPV